MWLVLGVDDCPRPAAPGLSEVRADVKLPKVFGSHMVLQRQRPLTIWGWADPKEQVTVRLDDITPAPATATATAAATPTTPTAIATATTPPTTATATAKADAKGDWQVVLPAVKADGKTHP